MGIQVINPPITSGSIAAALGFTPAATAISPIPVGTAAAPGAAFEGDTGTGIYSPGAGFFGISSEGKRVATFDYRSLGSTYENARFQLGTGAEINDESTDTYVGTIAPPACNWSGTLSRPVGLNLGTWAATITDQITKTGLAIMGELDKLDILASGGAVTVNRAAGWRIRSPIPHTDVTIARTTNLVFTDPSLAIQSAGGTVTSHEYIRIPATSGGTGGPTTTTGIVFEDKPNGGSISTLAGDELWLNSLGALTLNSPNNSSYPITIKGSSIVIDTYANTGRLQVKSAGDLIAEFQNTSAANYLVFKAASVPTIAAAHASSTDVAITLASKGAGNIALASNNGSTNQVVIVPVASAVNSVRMSGAATGGNPRIFPSAENLTLGLNSPLSTSATAGFIMIPGMNGTPSGAPTGAATGAIPFIYDYAAHKLWTYYSGTWRSVALT